MKLIKGLVKVANFAVEVPGAFSFTHIVSILLVVTLTTLLCIYMRDAKDRGFRIAIGVMCGVMILLEIFKQTFGCTTLEDGAIIYQYDWNSFPFQLCSTPLYVLPLLCLLPDCRVRDCAAAYIGTYTLVAGVAVYLTPATVFTEHLFINIQTMVHHGLQIVTGMYTLFYYRRRIDRRFFLGGVAVFTVTFALANLLNTAFYCILLSRGVIDAESAFNMFYISPYPEQKIPMFNDLLKTVPAVLVIIGYFLLLTFAAWLVTLAARLLYRYICERIGTCEDKDGDATEL